ncbi:unnamed protein product, partial [Ectocarpus sp. 12 AP-2014]
ALRRAALTGALEKPPPPGALLSAGQAEAQKEEFWRGHVKDLELSVPERLEKYSGKLAKLGRAVARLAAAGKKVLVLGALPDALLLVHQYLVETDVPHECWAGNGEMFPNVAGEESTRGSDAGTAAPAAAAAAAAATSVPAASNGSPPGAAAAAPPAALSVGPGLAAPGAVSSPSPALAPLSAHHNPLGSFPSRSSSPQAPATPPKPAHERLWSGVQGPLWRFRCSPRTPVLLAPPSAILDAVAGGSGLCPNGDQPRPDGSSVRRGSLLGLGPIDAVLIFDEGPPITTRTATATATATAATSSSRAALTVALQSLLTLPQCARRSSAPRAIRSMSATGGGAADENGRVDGGGGATAAGRAEGENVVTVVRYVADGTIEETLEGEGDKGIGSLGGRPLGEVLFGPTYSDRGSATSEAASAPETPAAAAAAAATAAVTQTAAAGAAKTSGSDPMDVDVEKGGAVAAAYSPPAAGSEAGVEGIAVRCSLEGKTFLNQGGAASASASEGTEAISLSGTKRKAADGGGGGGGCNGADMLGADGKHWSERAPPLRRTCPWSPVGVEDILVEEMVQMNPDDFDTGRGCFDTDETRVFARLADGGHPVPPPLLSYAVDATLAATPGRSFTERVRDLHLLGISPEPFLHCMPCIDLAMPPDHNMVLNEAVEVPSWMSTSFGQDLSCSLSYVDRLPSNRNKKLKKALSPRESSRREGEQPGAGRRNKTSVEEWTKMEDSLLVSAVQQFGENWVLVAFSINKCPILRGRMRSGSQCKARHANLVALGAAGQRSQRGARPLSVRLPPTYRGTAILPDQPAALTMAMRSR